MTDHTTNPDTAPASPTPSSTPDCLCMGVGPQLTALLRSVMPTTGLAESLRGTELDALTFLKTIIEQRISSLSGTPPDPRGTRVEID